ncbi:hypothetical protein SDC9_85848 [bioreactor metagenome]|uniref:Uncharacterized protein n=1 Tax=bioreactor metagenome TaxID=1076179 RepID=A0A644ZEA2_9ZZZZ
MGGFVFHPGTDERCLRVDQRNSLTLHVGTHQSTVGVIVFQERDAGCRDSNYLFWRNVHVIDAFDRNFQVVMDITGHDDIVGEASVFQ